MLRVLLGTDLALALGALGAGAAWASIGRSDRPFSGSFSGSSAHNLETGEFHAVWTGEASHFGISNLEEDAQVVFTGARTLGFSGSWTLTAANGDELYGTSVGTGVRTDAAHIIVSLDCTATGGTGRFADASGTFTITAHHARTALENGISYAVQEATLDGQLSW